MTVRSHEIVEIVRGVTHDFTGYYPYNDAWMRKWCEENFLGSWGVICHGSARKADDDDMHIKYNLITGEGLQNRLTIRIINKDDIVLFKLTWL
ncbi:MAG: hypothetical protein HC836_25795 [Richelia sp. RM2_1_2]|nr:hypothetical protein [Richelia sp. RM2_1_2]